MALDISLHVRQYVVVSNEAQDATVEPQDESVFGFT
jgi:hypothetical protein